MQNLLHCSRERLLAGECSCEKWMHPQLQREVIPLCCLLFAPPHMKLFDHGVPKPTWSGAFGVIGVCVSGALFLLSLHHPPQILQLWDIPNKEWGPLLCQSSELDWHCGW